MTTPSLDRSPHNIANCSFASVEASLAAKPSLLVPVAGLEPLGAAAALGCANLVCQALAAQTARRTDTLCAPLIALGASTPWQAFGGVGAVKARTLVNVLVEALESWRTQGFSRFYILDGMMENAGAVDEAALRAVRCGLSVRVLRWQADPQVREAVTRKLGVAEAGRCEYGLLCMAAALDPAAAMQLPVADVGRGSAADIARWRKRGRDPQRLRRLLPGGLLLPAGARLDAAFGAELLEVAATHFADTVTAGEREGLRP